MSREQAQRSIEELQRAVEADPHDIESRVALLVSRSRIEGPTLLLGALQDRKKWNETPAAIQDLALRELARRLDSIEFLGAKHFSHRSQNKKEGSAETCQHRIGCYHHKASDTVFHLLPGQGAISPFLISRWPVTNAQWQLWDPKTPSDDLPKVQVSFRKAVDYVSHWGFRLPSVKEWSYACRAGSTSDFYWGSDYDPEQVWCQNNCPDALPRSPLLHANKSTWNAFGLVDMLGNVYEWLNDGSLQGASFLDLWEVVAYWDNGGWALTEEQSTKDVGMRAVLSIPKTPGS